MFNSEKIMFNFLLFECWMRLYFTTLDSIAQTHSHSHMNFKQGHSFQEDFLKLYEYLPTTVLLLLLVVCIANT